MRWYYAQKPLFPILKKVSALITSGEWSRGRQLQSFFCVYDKLERDLFWSYNTINTILFNKIYSSALSQMVPSSAM